MSPSDPALDPAPTETGAGASVTSLAEPGFFARTHAAMHRHPVTGLIAKIVVTTLGVLVILAGVVMLVFPGPGIVAIILGLAILSTEWTWAGRLLSWARRRASEAAHRARTMDPAVRRRRVLLTGAVIACGVVLLTCWVAWQGWPQPVLDGWERVQRISDRVPDLPGG